MELMEHLIMHRRAAWTMSAVLSAAAAVAIFGFGAPPVILVGVAWGGALAYGKALSWAERRLGRH